MPERLREGVAREAGQPPKDETDQRLRRLELLLDM